MVVGNHFGSKPPPQCSPDLRVKLILLGDYSVGKSSLLRILARQSHQLTQEKIQKEKEEKEKKKEEEKKEEKEKGNEGVEGSLSTSQQTRATSRRSLMTSSGSRSPRPRPLRSGSRPTMSTLWEEGSWTVVRSRLQPGEFVEVEFLHQDKRVLARVADTGGQERYRSMTTSYYRGAHGCLILFDVTKEESFNNLTTWIDDMDRYKTVDELPCILVGTRCRSPARRIQYERATEFAESRGFPYMELDLDHMTNIRRVFEALLDSVTVLMNKPTAPIAIEIRPDISNHRDVLVEKRVACNC